MEYKRNKLAILPIINEGGSRVSDIIIVKERDLSKNKEYYDCIAVGKRVLSKNVLKEKAVNLLDATTKEFKHKKISKSDLALLSLAFSLTKY